MNILSLFNMYFFCRHNFVETEASKDYREAWSDLYKIYGYDVKFGQLVEKCSKCGYLRLGEDGLKIIDVKRMNS